MAKNCMAAVAKLLGVELGEEFIIENKDRKETVVLAADGFHVIQPNNVVGPDHGKLLSKVLQGLYEVKQKPWVPKYKEYYYCPSITKRRVIEFLWLGDTRDYAMKALGMIYHTKAEAEKHLAEDYERLTGEPFEFR